MLPKLQESRACSNATEHEEGKHPLLQSLVVLGDTKLVQEDGLCAMQGLWLSF